MAESNLSVTLSGKDNLTPTIKNAQKALTDMGNKSSKLEDISKSFDKITNSNARLSTKIKDIKLQMEKLAATGQNTTKEGKKMWEEMSKAAKEYDKQLKQIQNDTSSTGKSGNPLKDMTQGIMDKAGLGSIGSMLSNPWVLAGGAIIGATKALFDYNVELDRSLNRTAEFTGLSGDELMTMRNNIKACADTYGKDYNDVLSSVNGLMAQFGIESNEALEIIRKGFKSGSDEGGRMLDMISQYAGAFNDAGISADELVAIIGNTRSGIFSDEGMELFSKGAAKVREFSDKLRDSLNAVGIDAGDMYSKLQSGEMSTVQAIQAISTKLKELDPQSQEVGDVLKQVFTKKGAAAGYELVTALADVETNLDTVSNQTGEWGNAMERLELADRELENAMASLFGSSHEGFSTMTTQLKAEVFSGIAKVINGFIDLYNESLVVRGGVAALATVFKSAWEIIKGVLALLFNSLKSVAGVVEGVLTLDFNKVKSSWENGTKTVLKTVAKTCENISEDIKSSIDTALNGKIKKYEVPVEAKVEYSKKTNGEGKKGNGGISSGGDDSKSKSDKEKKVKEEKVKTQIELDREALQKVNKQVQDAMNDFNNGLISKETLEKTVDEANKYFEQNGIKSHVELEYDTKNGFDNVQFKKEDTTTALDKKRKSFNDLNSQAVQTRQDFEVGLIGFDEAKSKFEELNEKLKELDPNLKLDLHVNNDGTITSTADDIEKAKQKIQDIGDATTAVGGMFDGLGSAIGGTGGEILSFAGQSIAAIGQILPQILTLITAKNAEAIAAGTASGAELPFPANIAAIAGIVAAIAGIFASLPKFATGGVVGGGSYTGDRVLARLNSGEGVLTKKGMKNITNIMNNTDNSSNFGGNVSFRISGRDLVGVMNNHNSKMSKIK